MFSELLFLLHSIKIVAYDRLLLIACPLLSILICHPSLSLFPRFIPRCSPYVYPFTPWSLKCPPPPEFHPIYYRSWQDSERNPFSCYHKFKYSKWKTSQPVTYRGVRRRRSIYKLTRTTLKRNDNTVDWKKKTWDSGLKIRSDKCAIFYGWRSGNRWYKAKGETPPKIKIEEELVKILKRSDSFTYLGKPLTVAGETVEEISDILDTYSNLLQEILACPLSLSLKIEALQHVDMATIEHHFVNAHFTEENLEVLDKALKNFLWKLFDLHTNTAVRTMFLKKDKGGLGVRKPSLIYTVAQIGYLVNS